MPSTQATEGILPQPATHHPPLLCPYHYLTPVCLPVTPVVSYPQWLAALAFTPAHKQIHRGQGTLAGLWKHVVLSLMGPQPTLVSKPAWPYQL